LELQVQQELYVLALQEVVLDYKLQVVLHILVLNAGVDRAPDLLDHLIVLV
jgi:hypothetical protein